MRLLDVPDGVCPDKLRMSCLGDSTLMATMFDSEFVSCDTDCPGAELKYLKIWKIPLGCVQVCPFNGSDVSVEITGQTETLERPEH